MDDLISDGKAILRTRENRGAFSTAFRACNHWANERQTQRLTQRERVLRLWAQAIFLSSLAWCLHKGYRWSGHWSRFRTHHGRQKTRRLGLI
jgi:hypothetical protein